MTIRKCLQSIAFHILAVLISVIALVPFLWMISTSLKSSGALLAVPIQWIPEEPTLQAYVRLFSLTGILRSIVNSFIVTAGAVVFTLASSSLAAFALSKIEFRGREGVFMLFIASMMLPSQVLFIPLYLIMNNLGLVNNLFAIILPYLFQAFAVFMLRQQMMSIPDTYLDAAAIDGAGLLRSFITVFLPMCRTALVTLAIIISMNAWNDYLMTSLFLTKMETRTLAIAAFTFLSNHTADYSPMMAGLLIGIIPILIFYFIGQKYIIEGVVAGSVKG